MGTEFKRYLYPVREALEVFEEELMNRVNELISGIESEDVDVYLADAESREDIDEICNEYKIE